MFFMEQSSVVERALEIINRMSELNEQLARLMLENGQPKGALPAYVEYTPEQWQEYEHNRAEHFCTLPRKVRLASNPVLVF